MLQLQSLIIDLTRTLQPQLSRLAAQDAHFADQVRRALLGVALNLAEGAGAYGGNKRRAYRIACAEASELEMGLEMAAALGFITLSDEQRKDLQHALGALHKLARR